MKYLTILGICCYFLSSCSTFKSATQNQSASKQSRTQSGNNSAPRFLDNISVDMESRTNTQRAATIKSGNRYAGPIYTAAPGIESGTNLQFKYAILMDIDVEEVIDGKALQFIDEWYGTPYRLGGNSKQGIDCSAFTLLYASAVYGLTLPRTSREQREFTKNVNRTQLQEGDLVFFTNRKNKAVTHVGVYLKNNKFVHASTSGGIMISDLDESYWKPRYVGAGRMNT